MTDLDVFKDTKYGQAALRKLAPVAENFRLYCCGYIEKNAPFEIMKCTGAVFREAKSGPSKGELVVVVKGTERSAYVAQAEILAEKWEAA